MSSPARAAADPSVWRGDPVIVVYAVRHALGKRGDVAVFMRQAIAANVHQLPAAAVAALVRDITGWLDREGASAPEEVRQPWLDALVVLSGRRALVRSGVAR